MEMNVLPELLTILEKDYQSKSSGHIVSVICNLLAGDDDERQYCLDLNVVYHLKSMLNQIQDEEIIESILLSFSNITAGNNDQISVLIFNDILCVDVIGR